MSVFLLGGKAKGFEITLPSKVSFRPTSVMLRRKFFDYKQNWEEQTFVDLCAGSGVMSFEALSRGERQIYLNDTSMQQVKMLNQRKDSWCEKFPEDSSKIHISKTDSLKFTLDLEIKNGTWLFFDPPYEDIKLYQQFFEMMHGKVIDASSAVVVEYEFRTKSPPTWMAEMEKFRSNRKCRELQSSDRRMVIIQGE